MSDLRVFEVKIKGVTPIVFNRYPDAEEEKAKKGERDKVAFEYAHIKNRLYRTKDGQIYIPAAALKKAMELACRFVVEKPKGSFKTFGPLIVAALVVEDDIILDVTLDRMVPWPMPVSVNATRGKRGGTGTRVRPMFQLPWAGSTSCLVVDDALTAEALATIGRKAGRLCGLMDARTLNMGRCDISVKET